MAEQQDMISSLLDELAAEVMVLEAGDLMSYGEALSHLERLVIVCEGAGNPTLLGLVEALRGLVEGLILGEIADQDKGLELLANGLNLGQAVNRGDEGQEAVAAFLASEALGNRARAAAQAVGGEAPSGEPSEDFPLDEEEAAPAAPPEEEISPEELEAMARMAEEAPAPEAKKPPSIPMDDDEEAAAPAPSHEPPAEPINEEDREILEGFVAEALEHLESIEVNTLVLEDTPTDQEALNAVFRPFHTIKGVSGFLNLNDINHLAHALENLLDQARSGNLVVNSAAIDVVLAGVDQLRQMILEAQAAASENRGRRGFDTTALEKRVDAVLAGEEVDAAPKKRLGEVMIEKGYVAPEAVDLALEAQREKPEKPLGEILVHQGSADPSQVADGLRVQKSSAPAQRMAQEVKIDTAKLDNLLDMVGELVISQSMVQANPHVRQVADRKLNTDLAQLSRITTELQKTTMSMRMVPIKQTFQKMVRVVRDTAKKQKKSVRLELVGEGTEIDRNMVERFYDPLVHMVRNSVDHGIEAPEERIRAGKPEEGVVVLSAYHKGGSVCIEIKDDGKGLDRDKIVMKAVERGLISSDEGMTDEEVFHLIMQPGFSTAEKITDISGRGVGMDVVQRTVDELRGKIEVHSILGEGSTVTIALPLTLAIIDGMVVQVGQERFILPTISVAESLRPQKKDYTTVQGRGEMIMIRGNLIPLIRLHRVVEKDPDQENPWDALVVVVEHHGHRRCLLVDRLVGRQEVVIKSLGEALKDVRVVAGGAIMGDGRVGLILDVEGIFRAHEGRRS